MSFPRFAGGKFISNCLSLSKFCCPQDSVSAEYLLGFPDDYEYRLNSIMRTLPAKQSDMINWIEKYEFGDEQLYQNAFGHWKKGIQCHTNDLVNRLLKSNFKLFLTAHGGDIDVKNLLKAWPDAVIIKLINHTTFSKISQILKSSDNKSIDDYAGNYCKTKYNLLAGPQWPTWEEFESVGYDICRLSGYNSVADEILTFYNWKDVNNKTLLFDIDSAIFNQTKFLTAIEQLYIDLELSDFKPELVKTFWTSYMSLHVDNVDIT